MHNKELEEELQKSRIDYDTIIKFAPIILIVLLVFLQYKFFVTPEQLEVKHRQIINEVADRYTTKEQSNDLKNQLNDMQRKIDKIYDYVVKTR